MGERRRTVADLDRSLARHRRREARTAVALLELERDPAHRLLDAGGADGQTARRWQAVRPVRDALWRDFARWSALLADAERARARRSLPSASELADLRRALGAADLLVPSIRAALADLQAFVHACAYTPAAVAAVLIPVREQLAGARRAVVDLGLGPDDPDAVAARRLAAAAAARERDAAADPLRFTGSRRDVADLERPVGALLARLDPLTRLRTGWDAHVAALTADVDDVPAHRARTARTVARARAELRDVVPAMPPDRSPRLDTLRDTTMAADGWRARHDAVVALRDAVAEARAELDGTATLAVGLLERRDDLRGRFGAYRARSRRLGHGDDPELTELAGRIATRLWAVPAELARATRDLAAYRRRSALLGAS